MGKKNSKVAKNDRSSTPGPTPVPETEKKPEINMGAEKKNDDHLPAIKEAIKSILSQEWANVTYDGLLSRALAMTLNQDGERLYDALKVVMSEHLDKEIREELIPSINNSFLKTLSSRWIQYQTSITLISQVLSCVDRHYCQRKHVDTVYNLALILFREKVVPHGAMRNHCKEQLLDMVRRQQSGEMIDGFLIKNTIEMLIRLGINNRSFYEEIFENEFLLQSIQFNQVEMNKVIDVFGLGLTYLKEVEIRLSQIEREAVYLDKITASKLCEAFVETLVKKYMQTIAEQPNSGIVHMLKYRKTHDIKLMYHVFKRVDKGIKMMAEFISGYFREEIAALVHQEEETNAIIFVQNFLDLKDRLDDFLANSFCKDKTIEEKINADFEHYLNLNQKSPEYISIFIDDKLRKGVKGMSEQEIETLFDKTVVLFQFVLEKDVFERYYKQHLAKRLLLSKSVSVDSEKNMISKLKLECGSQFTAKLEGMFKDMAVCNTIMEEFKEHIASTQCSLHGVDLSVRVLTTELWPLRSVNANGIIPQAPREAFEVFKRFYLNKHIGRQLTLNPQLGSADLNAVFYGPRKEEGEGKDGASSSTSSMNAAAGSKLGPRKHIIQVSTYQMCILVLFNNRDELTYEEILQTDIPEKYLIRVLQSLAMGKASQRILTKTPKTKEIEPSDTFKVNESFTSKLHRVKIQTVAAKGESEPERKETRNKVDEDRKHEIEATIVRIMKARKKLPHASLVAECTEQLKSRFLPSPVVIKKRVEDLIEREYLARMTEDRTVYTYVA